MHLAKSFREKLAYVPFGLDHPWWVEDKDFDLEYHIRHIALPKPGDWRQLCIQTARLISRPLDMARPLWEVYVIEGLDNVEGVPPGSFALVSVGHHASMDGVSGMEMTTATHDHVRRRRATGAAGRAVDAGSRADTVGADDSCLGEQPAFPGHT